MPDNNEIIIASAAYAASPDNYEEFEQELEPAKLGEKLRQENTRKATVREYQLYAASHLLLNFIEGKKAAAKKYRVNLTYVSPEPEHHRVIKWNWLYAALAAAALLGLFVFLGVRDVISLQYTLIGGAISFTIAAICVLVFVYLMRDEYIFKSQYGNIGLFVMDNMKPDQKTFTAFFPGYSGRLKPHSQRCRLRTGW